MAKHPADCGCCGGPVCIATIDWGARWLQSGGCAYTLYPHEGSYYRKQDTIADPAVYSEPVTAPFRSYREKSVYSECACDDAVVETQTRTFTFGGLNECDETVEPEEPMDCDDHYDPESCPNPGTTGTIVTITTPWTNSQILDGLEERNWGSGAPFGQFSGWVALESGSLTAQTSRFRLRIPGTGCFPPCARVHLLLDSIEQGQTITAAGMFIAGHAVEASVKLGAFEPTAFDGDVEWSVETNDLGFITGGAASGELTFRDDTNALTDFALSLDGLEVLFDTTTVQTYDFAAVRNSSCLDGEQVSAWIEVPQLEADKLTLARVVIEPIAKNCASALPITCI